MNKTWIGASALALLGVVALPEQPALALDVSRSVSVGGVSAKAGASIDRGGASLGVGVKSDRGGVSAKAGVDRSGGASAEASASAGGESSAESGRSSSGGSSGGGGDVSRSASTGGGSSAGSGSGSGGVSSSAGDGSSRPSSEAGYSPGNLALPRSLVRQFPCPADGNRCNSEPESQAELDAQSPEYLQAVVALARSLAPVATVSACRSGIVQGAMPYDPVRVDAVSVGRVEAQGDGAQMAPLMVRIVYAREGGFEVREAEVDCILDAGGNVVALS